MPFGIVFSCKDAAQEVLMSVRPCEFHVEILSQCANLYSSRMFQNVPECSRMFQNVPECSRIHAEFMQNVPIQNVPECMQNVPECMQNVPECMQNVPECIQNVPECSKMHADDL